MDEQHTGPSYRKPIGDGVLKQLNQSVGARSRFEHFVEEARRYERKLRRFQTLELRLIGLSSLLDVVQAIIYPDHTAFKWDSVTLLLVDSEYEIRRTIEEEGVNLADYPSLLFVSSMEEFGAIFPNSLFPALGPYKPGKHSALFAKSRSPLRSVALLPLVRYGKLIGSVNIGAESADRFITGMRTDFFEHFAAIVAICIENAVNLQRLKRQGLTDTLTAINNRRFFDQRLKEELALSMRNGTPLSCMLLDVDHFKRVNDTYGHQVGDQVLREVAAIVRAQLRGSDVLSRYGGEEFAALLAQTSADEVAEVAERIRCAIEQHAFILPHGIAFKVTISIGVFVYDSLQIDPSIKIPQDLLVGIADNALYKAKAQGRNRVEITDQFHAESLE